MANRVPCANQPRPVRDSNHMETPLRGRDEPVTTGNERPGNTPACAGKGDVDLNLTSYVDLNLTSYVELNVTSYTMAAPPLNARG